jgi:hypothetical protein
VALTTSMTCQAGSHSFRCRHRAITSKVSQQTQEAVKHSRLPSTKMSLVEGESTTLVDSYDFTRMVDLLGPLANGGFEGQIPGLESDISVTHSTMGYQMPCRVP